MTHITLDRSELHILLSYGGYTRVRHFDAILILCGVLAGWGDAQSRDVLVMTPAKSDNEEAAVSARRMHSRSVSACFYVMQVNHFLLGEAALSIWSRKKRVGKSTVGS